MEIFDTGTGTHCVPRNLIILPYAVIAVCAHGSTTHELE